MKYVNFLLLFLLLFFIFIFKDNIKPSTDLLSLFSSKESMQALEIATELGYTKEMMIAVKGFEDSSKNSKVIESYLLPKTLKVTAQNPEIIFSKSKGETTENKLTIISREGSGYEIKINEIGKIEIQ